MPCTTTGVAMVLSFTIEEEKTVQAKLSMVIGFPSLFLYVVVVSLFYLLRCVVTVLARRAHLECSFVVHNITCALAPVKIRSQGAVYPKNGTPPRCAHRKALLRVPPPNRVPRSSRHQAQQKHPRSQQISLTRIVNQTNLFVLRKTNVQELENNRTRKKHKSKQQPVLLPK